MGRDRRDRRTSDADLVDARELRRFGYAQQLKRSMGVFSSFAISFSLISINTGIFANFGFGIRQVGPAIIWSWTLVVVGQLLVALVIAELATRFPLSGYGYQWTSRLVSPHFGFFVGWLLLLQFLTGFPGVCNALAQYMHPLIGTELQARISVPLLTVLVISAIALVHLGGIYLASRVNDIGVLAEIAGAVVITAVLLAIYGFQRDDGWRILLDTTNSDSGNPATLSNFALSLLMGAWCLTGFEAAADLAEETHRPRRTVPWAVVSSELSSGIVGFLMLAAFILAIDNMSTVQASETPLMTILESRFGGRITTAAMLVVFVSIFACGVASMAATTRLIFSLARDNMLPGSTLLKRVGRRSQSPTGAIALVWIIASAVVLGLKRLDLITSISATAGYLGYACIVWAALRTPRSSADGGTFTLGRFAGPVAIAAMAWTLLVAAALTLPEVNGEHLAFWSTAVGISIGVALYIALIRRRILRSEAGPPPEAADSETIPVKGQ